MTVNYWSIQSFEETTMRISLLVIICVTLLALNIQDSSAQLQFNEVSNAAGILPNDIEPGFGGGVSAFDYDQDGDVDLYLPQRFGSPDRFYANNGDGTFADIAANSGIDIDLTGRSALWFDYDDDHRVDLLIVSDCFNSQDPDCASRSSYRLYRQTADGTFEDVSVETGIENSKTQTFFGHRAGVCCGDVDRDGDLDLLIGQWEGELELLINHSGVFVNEAVERGITNPNDPFPYNPWQSVMHDFNGDGWIDIFTAVDFFDNQLWLNQGDGTFTNVADSSGTSFAFNEMGVTLGDYDADGDFDIYVTNIFEKGKYNLLLKNESTVDNVLFEEVAAEAGVDDTGFGWGATFFDADNDTLLDLAVTNGWFNGIGFDDESRMFLNNGDKPVTFRDVSTDVGFNDSFFGSCLISVDLSQDGDLDLVQVCNPGQVDGPFRLLENQLKENETPDTNWLVVRPRQLGQNRWCIGAIVTVDVGNKTICREISAGTSMHGQVPAESFFGLGANTMVDRVTVKWPFGDESVWENVAAGQIFTAYDADVDVDGDVDFLDMLQMASQVGPCDLCQADLNHDGTVSLLDIILLRPLLLGSK